MQLIFGKKITIVHTSFRTNEHRKELKVDCVKTEAQKQCTSFCCQGITYTVSIFHPSVLPVFFFHSNADHNITG